MRELGRHDEALAAFDRALAAKPDLAGAWLGRGNVFCELKRYDEALPAYDRALELLTQISPMPGLAAATCLANSNVTMRL